jgi:predicted alpha/beta hydrolase
MALDVPAALPERASVPSVTGVQFNLVAADGFALAAEMHEPVAPVATLLVAPATGVSRRIYRRLAGYLSSRGLATLLLDYRGTGESRPASLRGFHASADDWAAQDLSAAVGFLKDRHPTLPLTWLGHSIGGQLFGLCPERRRVRAAVFVAAQNGHWRHWQGLLRWRMLLNWYVVVPALVRAFGYLPMRRFTGSGEDVPAAMALQWASWGRDRRYLLASRLADEQRAFGDLRVPLCAYSFSDDPLFGPATAVDALLAFYSSAAIERRRLVPAELGLERIGHFGWLRPEFEAPLWAGMADWLLAQELGHPLGDGRG